MVKAMKHLGKRMIAMQLLAVLLLSMYPVSVSASAAAGDTAGNSGAETETESGTSYDEVSAYKCWSFSIETPVTQTAAQSAVKVYASADGTQTGDPLDTRIYLDEDEGILSVMYPEGGYTPGGSYLAVIDAGLSSCLAGLPESGFQFHFTISMDDSVNEAPIRLAANVHYFTGEDAGVVLDEIQSLEQGEDDAAQMFLKAEYASRASDYSVNDSLFQLGVGDIFVIEDADTPLGSMSGKITDLQDESDGSRCLTFVAPELDELFSELTLETQKVLAEDDLLSTDLPEGASLTFGGSSGLEEGKVGSVTELPTINLSVPTITLLDGDVTLSADIALENPTLDASLEYESFSWRPFGHTVIPDTPYGVSNARLSLTADATQDLKITASGNESYSLKADKGSSQTNTKEYTTKFNGSDVNTTLGGVDYGNRYLIGSATFRLDTRQVIVDEGPPKDNITLGACLFFTVTLEGDLEVDASLSFSNDVHIKSGFEYSDGKLSSLPDSGATVDSDVMVNATGTASLDLAFGVGAGFVTLGVVTADITVDFGTEIDVDGAVYIEGKYVQDDDGSSYFTADGSVNFTQSFYLDVDASVDLSAQFDAKIKIWWFNIKLSESFQAVDLSYSLLHDTLYSYTLSGKYSMGDALKNVFVCDFYNTTDWSGGVVNTLYENSIDHNWKDGSPVAFVNTSGISAYWKGNFDFDEGTYCFVPGFSGTAQVWIDGSLVFDSAGDGVSAMNSFLYTFDDDGNHTIEIKASYPEGTDKIAYFDWGQAADNFSAVYYNASSFEEAKADVTADTGRSYAQLEDSPALDTTDAGPYAEVTEVFGARWEKTADFGNGYYNFIIGVDSYAALYVDGELITEVSGNGSDLTYSYEQVNMQAGTHTIVLLYAGDGDASTLSFYYGVPPQDAFVGIYYSGASRACNPSYVAYTDSLDFDWGENAPNDNVSKNFCASYDGYFTFDEDGEYLFTCSVDDTATIYVDGSILMERDAYSANTLYATIELTAGTHRIRVDYEDIGGAASLELNWAQTDNQFVAFYGDGTDAQSSPISVSVVDQIANNWGTAAPANGVSADNFAAYWVGTFTFDEGDYYFNVLADDKIIVTVDGTTVWSQGQAAGQWGCVGPISLTAGEHTVEVTYQEISSNAYAFVNWVLADTDNLYLAKLYYVSSYDDLASKVSAGSAPNYVLTLDGLSLGSSEYESDAALDMDALPSYPGFDNVKFGIWLTGNVEFDGGGYVVAGSADDRMTVSLDGSSVLDTTWSGAVVYQYTEQQISAGTHAVQALAVNTGGAYYFKMLFMDKGDGNFCVRYYNDDSRTGSPVYLDTTDGSSISENWGTGSPAAAVNSDHFSAVYEGDFDFDGGYYVFQSSSDDMCQVYLDGSAIQPSSRGTDVVTYVSRGTHTVQVDYAEETGSAALSVSWEEAESNTLYTCYYDNQYPDSDAVITSSETIPVTSASYSQNWGSGGPAGTGKKDYFAVTYSGVFEFDSGTYTFNVTADDGVNLMVDGVNVGIPQKNGSYSASLNLTAGQHTVTVQYKENTGNAYVNFSWAKK